MSVASIAAVDAVRARMRELDRLLGSGDLLATWRSTPARSTGAMPSGMTSTAATTAPARTSSFDVLGATAPVDVALRPASPTSWFGSGWQAPTVGGATATAPATRLGDVPYAQVFEEAGERWGIDPAILAAVGYVESRYRPDAVSSAGAVGMMQLMPQTAQSLGVDPTDPVASVDAAARLLRSLQDRFGSVELALAAYNVGPGTVARAGSTVGVAAGYVDAVMDRAAVLRGGPASEES